MTTDRILLALSTAAAAIAAYYAFRAVHDGQAFHREQERDAARARLYRVADALSDLAPVAATVGIGGPVAYGRLRGCFVRFKTAVETTAAPIPLCRELAAYALPIDATLPQWKQFGTQIDNQWAAAFDELRAAIMDPGG